MKNKKGLSILTVGVLAASLIVGTYAWFISQDSVINNFSTAKKGSITIWEKFDENEAQNRFPGETVTKVVQIQNSSEYAQYIRARIEREWMNPVTNVDIDCKHIFDEYGDPLYEEQGIEHILDLIGLDISNERVSENDYTKPWYYNSKDGYFYYLGKVESKKFTHELLDSVTLSRFTDGCFQEMSYEVEVIAEGIQVQGIKSANDIFNAWGTKGHENNELWKILIESKYTEFEQITDVKIPTK